MTIELRVDQEGAIPDRLRLTGRWHSTPTGPLRFAIDGEVVEADYRLPTSGSVLVWPRRVLGGIVGLHRIELDVHIGPHRLSLGGEAGRPPYWPGITLPGTLTGPRRSYDVRVSIDSLQLAHLWLVLTAVPPLER